MKCIDVINPTKKKKLIRALFTGPALRPIQSRSCDIQVSVCLFVCVFVCPPPLGEYLRPKQ